MASVLQLAVMANQDMSKMEAAMPENTTEANRLCLTGDFTISGVADQFPLLAQHLAQLTDTQCHKKLHAGAADDLPEMDLVGITALDACGCQLLALFSRALLQSGISLRIRNIPEEFIAKIRLLGFDRDLNLSL